MMDRGSEFTDLTRLQVEALLECFDFLRNGYVPVIDFNVNGRWIIKLRHKKNGNMLVVTIMTDCYIISKNGKVQKTVMMHEGPDRYRLFVNSDMSVGVVRLCPGADAGLIPDSLSTNKDAR